LVIRYGPVGAFQSIHAAAAELKACLHKSRVSGSESIVTRDGVKGGRGNASAGAGLVD
jgi:hypothetical protein